MNLPVPRLQIVWTKDEKEECPWKATYELVLYEGEESLLDIRANDDEGPTKNPVTVEMGVTNCSGGSIPYNFEGTALDIPFRDGVHMQRDSIRLGNLPMYIVYGEQVEEYEQQLVKDGDQWVNKSLLEKA